MNDEKLCPMNFSNGDHLVQGYSGTRCVEDKCAWWIVYMAGTDQEWSECAICALGGLYNLPAG